MAPMWRGGGVVSAEIPLNEAALAWAQGKKVEACAPTNSIWCRITGVGACVEKSPRGQYPADVFTSDLKFRFRIAPEPPPMQYRPFTKDTIPKFALWKYPFPNESPDIFYVATQYGNNAVMMAEYHWVQYQDLMTNGALSLDNGKTWQVAGEEVSS